jgi:CRP-like cAMP-binding protein
MTKIWYLSPVALFAGLPEEDTRRLFQWMHTATYEAERTVFSSQVPGDVIYSVRRGCLRLIQISPGGSTRRITTLQAGDLFGSLELVPQGFRRAQVSTESEVQLLVLRKNALEKLIKYEPAMSGRLMDFLNHFLAEQYAPLYQAEARQCRGRILRLLQHTLSHPDYAHEGQSACGTRELSELTGASTEAVERVLEELQARRLIQVRSGGLKILNAEALRGGRC